MEIRTPVYNSAISANTITPSPSVRAGLRVSAGLKRNERMPGIVVGLIGSVTPKKRCPAIRCCAVSTDIGIGIAIAIAIGS